jgi:hypothetical protein
MPWTGQVPQGARVRQKIASIFLSTYLWILLFPLILRTGGVASNQLVLFVNHDRFPVAMNVAKLNGWVPEEARIVSDDGIVMIDSVHCLMTSKTHLNILADIFDFHKEIESIGDIMIEYGEWMWTFCPFIWGALLIFKASRTEV